MIIERMRLSELKPAAYNPRKDLTPDDAAYQKIETSLATFGMVEPIIWNKNTGHIVSGHQRIKILKANNIEETDVSVVDLSLKDEKILNIQLNRLKGRWDNDKLPALIQEIQEHGDLSLTGFDEWELQGIIQERQALADILDYQPPEPAEDEPGGAEETIAVTFQIPTEYRQLVNDFIDSREHGEWEISDAIIDMIQTMGQGEGE